MDPAAELDNYLKGKGSPMVGQGAVLVAAGKKYGVDPKLVVAISGAESSFGKYAYHPYNAWGWGGRQGQTFNSWAQSISQITKGLRDGYISQGLRTPQQIVNKYAPASDGNDTGVWSGNVSHFMHEMGANPLVAGPKTAFSSTPISLTAPPELGTPALDQIIIGNAGLNPDLQVRNLVEGLMAGAGKTRPGKTTTYRMPSPIPLSSTPLPRALASAKLGDPVPLSFQTSVGAEHPTAGLPGFPAYDYMAPAGAPVVAPVSGTVVRFSGHDPTIGPTQGVHGPFGWSMYIQGDNGSEYYLTHMGSRGVKVGQRVSQGQPIGTVGNYARWGGANHVHMGVNGSGRR